MKKLAKHLSIIGMLWGDEGKGKITDFLAKNYEVLVRYQGGDNAGHTIIINGEKKKMRLLPSGIFNSQKIVLISNGMVLNLSTLLHELKIMETETHGNKVYISDRAHIVFPYHLNWDNLVEEVKGNAKIGTTKRGIGPCYEDKVARVGIRAIDLLNKNTLIKKIELALLLKNHVFKVFKKPLFVAKELADEFYQYGQKIKHLITNTSVLLEKEWDKKSVLFEGAQGAMLSLDHGSYPFVTSSSPLTSIIPVATGINYHLCPQTLGIIKAYATRVGEGIFLTEESSIVAEKIRKRGHEYGTVSGRPRRIGWLDLVVLKHVKRTSGVNFLGITLVDVLSGITNIKICTHYLLGTKKITEVPADLEIWNKCTPVYKIFPGWNEPIANIKKFSDLPKNCQKYLQFIAKELQCPIKIISYGSDRKDTLIL